MPNSENRRKGIITSKKEMAHVLGLKDTESDAYGYEEFQAQELKNQGWLIHDANNSSKKRFQALTGKSREFLNFNVLEKKQSFFQSMFSWLTRIVKPITHQGFHTEWENHGISCFTITEKNKTHFIFVNRGGGGPLFKGDSRRVHAVSVDNNKANAVLKDLKTAIASKNRNTIQNFFRNLWVKNKNEELTDVLKKSVQKAGNCSIANSNIAWHIARAVEYMIANNCDFITGYRETLKEYKEWRRQDRAHAFHYLVTARHEYMIPHNNHSKRDPYIGIEDNKSKLKLNPVYYKDLYTSMFKLYTKDQKIENVSQNISNVETALNQLAKFPDDLNLFIDTITSRDYVLHMSHNYIDPKKYIDRHGQVNLEIREKTEMEYIDLMTTELEVTLHWIDKVKEIGHTYPDNNKFISFMDTFNEKFLTGCKNISTDIKGFRELCFKIIVEQRERFNLDNNVSLARLLEKASVEQTRLLLDISARNWTGSTPLEFSTSAILKNVNAETLIKILSVNPDPIYIDKTETKKLETILNQCNTALFQKILLARPQLIPMVIKNQFSLLISHLSSTEDKFFKLIINKMDRDQTKHLIDIKVMETMNKYKLNLIIDKMDIDQLKDIIQSKDSFRFLSLAYKTFDNNQTLKNYWNNADANTLIKIITIVPSFISKLSDEQIKEIHKENPEYFVSISNKIKKADQDGVEDDEVDEFKKALNNNGGSVLQKMSLDTVINLLNEYPDLTLTEAKAIIGGKEPIQSAIPIQAEKIVASRVDLKPIRNIERKAEVDNENIPPPTPRGKPSTEKFPYRNANYSDHYEPREKIKQRLNCLTMKETMQQTRKEFDALNDRNLLSDEELKASNPRTPDFRTFTK